MRQIKDVSSSDTQDNDKTNVIAVENRDDPVAIPSLAFDLAAFNSLFPFHLILDPELRIRQAGASLTRIAQLPVVGVMLEEAFCVRTTIPLHFAALRESSEPLILELKPNQEMRLKGNVFAVNGEESAYLLFVGSPFIRETEEVQRLGLRQEDFAAHDSLTDYLQEKEAHRSTRSNADLLAHQLQHRGAELIEINQRLQESETRYRTVIDNLSQVVFQTDSDGLFTFLNAAWFAITSFPVGETLGNHSADYILSEDRALHDEQMRLLYEEGKEECRYVVRCRRAPAAEIPGEENICWMGVNIRLARDLQNQVTGTSGTLTDISARKRAEQDRADALGERARALNERENALEALRESETYLRTVVMNAPIVLLALDRDGFFTLSAGKRLEQMGLPIGGVVGKSAWDVYQKMPEITDLIRRALAGETVNAAHHWHHAAFDLQFSPVFGADDAVTGVIGIAIDFTERLKMEERLKAVAVDLQRSNQVLQEFASIASHDLQEPLRKIQAFGGRLKSTNTHLSTEGIGYLDKMLNSANRMQNLINDLLSFSRVSTKSLPFAPVDLNEVVQRVWLDLEPVILRCHAQIVVDSLPVIEADPLQMRQLLKNLIANSLKFQREEVPPHIKIKATLQREQGGRDVCCLTIADNGIGFENRYATRIFNVFEQLHSRARYEGTGMGLAICRQIIERHRGSIIADGTPGAGSVFTITLPVRAIQGEETYEI